MRSRAILPDKDHLVLGAVKRAHSGVGLVPNANVLEFGVVSISSCEHFSHVAPVHADLVDRTIGRMSAEQGIYTGEEVCELTFAHFAGGHSKFTMLDTTQSGYVAIDLYVIGRVGKNELGLLVVHQQLVSRSIRGISADEDMLSEHPDITQAANRRTARLLGH